MNRSFLSLALRALLFSSATIVASNAYSQMATLPQASPASTVTQTVGITELSVAYSRPSVNGREIWGKLVPYGLTNLGWAGADSAPWRAGANENTVITFEHDAKIEGQPIAAGSYGLHLILEESGDTTVILSNDYESWGSYFYDASKDALRVKVKASESEHVEQLTYSFSEVAKTSALLSLEWEKLSIPIRISVDTDAICSHFTQTANAKCTRFSLPEHHGRSELPSRQRPGTGARPRMVRNRDQSPMGRARTTRDARTESENPR